MIDISAILDDFPRATAVVTAVTSSVVNSGGRVVETTSAATRTPVVHPATEDQLEQLQVADRTRGTIALYDTIAYALGATLTYAERTYRVTRHQDYGDIGGIHMMLADVVDAHTEDE